MHKSIAAVSAILAVTVSTSFTARADNHEQTNLDPVDLYGCTFREGKTMADLDPLDAQFKKWADRNDKDQSAWRIVPIWRASDEPFHVGYIASWNSGNDMGAGMAAWTANAELNAAYSEVIECGHSLHASVEINAPKGPPEDGIVWFSSCTVQENANDQLAFEAHKRMAAAMREMGGKGQSWLFYPSLGLGKVKFDYYSVVSFNNLEELGEGWEMYYNKGGWRKAMAMDTITECDSPRVYKATAIRMGPQN